MGCDRDAPANATPAAAQPPSSPAAPAAPAAPPAAESPAPDVATLLGDAFEGAAVPINDTTWIVVGVSPDPSDEGHPTTRVLLVRDGKTVTEAPAPSSWLGDEEQWYCDNFLSVSKAEAEPSTMPAVVIECGSGEDVLQTNEWYVVFGSTPDSISSVPQVPVAWSGRGGFTSANQVTGCSFGVSAGLEARADGLYLVKKGWSDQGELQADIDPEECEPAEVKEPLVRISSTQ